MMTITKKNLVFVSIFDNVDHQKVFIDAFNLGGCHESLVDADGSLWWILLMRGLDLFMCACPIRVEVDFRGHHKIEHI
jgi:hypothetical protein